MIFTLDVIKLHVLQNIESLAMHTQLKTSNFLPDSLAYSMHFEQHNVGFLNTGAHELFAS